MLPQETAAFVKVNETQRAYLDRHEHCCFHGKSNGGEHLLLCTNYIIGNMHSSVPISRCSGYYLSQRYPRRKRLSNPMT